MPLHAPTHPTRQRLTAKRAAGAVALAGTAGIAAYVVLLRPRLQRWGATDAEATGPMPADELVAQPDLVTTLAVTVRARPEDVWPWLAQMGYRRGGLYSYDWLDRLFGYLDRPSATEVLPEFQHLEAGDTIPLGRGPSWPVRVAHAPRALVLEPMAGAITWVFALTPLGDGSTRLVSRVRCRVERTLPSFVTFAAMEPAAFVMTRRMLLNIKRRAERLARGATRANR